jgi:energy-coupling factor transporter transmembrane protein EcfT
MYVTHLFPLTKQFFRKSTEGLSPLLFLCAFLGNFTYALSIFLYSTRGTFILAKLPWIVGSAGVLMLDLLILLQFVLFRKKKSASEVVDPVGLDSVAENDPSSPKTMYDVQNN